MDWTGGVRRRFASGKNGATVQKQKAHFAKARAALQNTPSSHSTFKPRFLNSDVRDGGRRARAAQKHSSRHHEKSIAIEQRKRRRSKETAHEATQFNKSTRTSQQISQHRERRTSPSRAISISSGSPSSQSEPIDHKQSVKRSHCSSSPLQTAFSEEERLLLANRRRLLARTDWLGLSALRPVQIKFPRSQDREHIGKRRKIGQATSRKGEAAGRRLLTPLFKDHRQGDHLMSGALPVDDIEIKIGTDALASQNQRSRQSHTPGRTSMRHPSIEFGPISEESMLLGADGDSFEEHDHPEHADFNHDHPLAMVKSQVAIAGSHMTYDTQQAPHAAGIYRHNPDDHHYEHVHTHPQVQVNEPDGGGHVTLVPDSERQEDWQTVPEVGMIIESDEPHRPVAIAPMLMSQMPHDRQLLSQTTDSHTRDERAWRQLWNIDGNVLRHSSLKALKSSSLHNDTTDSSVRPFAGHGVEPTLSAPPEQETVQSKHPQDRKRQHSINGPAEVNSCFESACLQSPSTSLAQITRLAEQPAITSKHIEEDENDNALWRQFIIGSQDSSEEANDHQAGLDGGNGIRHIASTASASSNFTVSGLGTSDKATVGDTLFLTGNTPSRTSQTLQRRKYELSPERKAGHSATQTSMIAEQSNTVIDRDNVEDDPRPDELQPRPSGNIHTPNTSILNPKRFKPPKKTITHVARRSSRFLPSRKAKSNAKKDGRSVYDLVDSDDMSVY